MKSLESVGGLLKTSAFRFPDVCSAAIERYSPRFNVRTSEAAGSTRSKSTSTPSPRDGIKRSVTSPDEVFATPTTSFPPSYPNTKETFDPYQIFEVNHRPCLILEVKVLSGRNITKGWADYVMLRCQNPKDGGRPHTQLPKRAGKARWSHRHFEMDTPDPYIFLGIRTAPEGRKQTTIKDNDVNPEWNESFTFLLDDTLENILEVRLMESNLVYDEIVGTTWIQIDELKRDAWEKRTLVFNEVSMVDIEMKLSLDQNPTLRYSLCLCDKEKDFLRNRREKILTGLQHLLGNSAPNVTEEVPTIAVIGSGGGFRAMVGMSGVTKALHDSGVLQCATYICGLSGSSWYISTLYSHPNWPNMAPGDMQEELKLNIDSSLLWLLSPQGVYRYLDRIMKKRKNGQPVSFTDFFGHMVGETLIKDRLDCKLSDQQERIADGKVPCPLMTCVHVKKDRSARSFSEWVEFSPFEIGMAKYGTFMPTELFGSKFFMGKLCKEFDENPLHFLQGIWGSAFCILFKRLLEDNRKLDPVEMIRQEMAKQLEENEQDESSDSSDDGEFDDTDSPSTNQKSKSLPARLQNGSGSTAFSFSRDAKARLGVRPDAQRSVDMRNGRPDMSNGRPGSEMNRTPKRMISTRRTKQKGYWTNFIQGVMENKNLELLNTRAGRAGVIHNFMRGLSLQESYPLSPFSPDKKEPDTNGAGDEVDAGVKRISEDFDGIFEMHPTNVKHMYIVDAGLTFNSPYPLVLRPQREVDIILSFDFSARPSDSTPPFKELLLAADWARKQKVPFPPIDTTVFDREGMKELYVFRHPTDANCPIVLHFCLVNIEFRKYSKPGVRRRTSEEKEFANFEIFDDPNTPYSTFNFKYPHLAFDRLAKLTEFNTLLNVDTIKEVILEAVEKKRKNPPKLPCKLEDIPKLRRVSQKNKSRLSKFVSRIRSGRYSASEAKKDIDISTDRDDGRLTITEENSVDLYSEQLDDNQLSTTTTTTTTTTTRLQRKIGMTKRSPRPFRRMDEVTEDTDQAADIPDGTKRDVPGRRKPRQPEELWKDSKCNSIDEGDDSQFFTALG